MAYRTSEIGLMAQMLPERAKRELLSAFRALSAEEVAEKFGVTRRTVDRIVRALGIAEEVERLSRARRRKQRRAAA